MSGRRRAFAGAVWVTLAGQLCAVAYEIAVAGRFGTGVEADALALTVVIAVANEIAGWVSTLFVPHYIEAQQKAGATAAGSFFRVSVGLLAGGTALLMVGLIVASSSLAGLLAPGAAVRQIGAGLLRLFAPLVVLLPLSVLLAGALQAHGRFVVASLRQLCWYGVALVAGVVAILLALIYARSVGAWAGLAIASVLVGVVATRVGVPPVGPRWLLAMCVGVVFLAAGVTLWKIPVRPDSVSVRLVAYRIGLAAIAERRVLGFGANGYARESPRLERALYGRMLGPHFPWDPLSAHSSYMEVAVERGLPALAAFLGLLLAILIPGIRGVRQCRDPGRRVLLLGLVAGLTAFALQAFTENLFSFSKVAGVFWIAAAALVALSREPGGG